MHRRIEDRAHTPNASSPTRSAVKVRRGGPIIALRTLRKAWPSISCAVRIIAVVVAIAYAPLPVALPAQGRPPIVNGVELQVLSRPATVLIAGTLHLVYEVHITNLLTVELALSRLQVLETRSRAAIADYSGEDLVKRVGQPGLRRGEGALDKLGAGRRAIAYLWIDLGSGSAIPSAITHRIEVDILRQPESVHAVVEGGGSPVSAQDAVVLDPPLRGGPWVAIYDPDLNGGHRRFAYTIDGMTRIPGRFAIDWIRLPPDGAIERGPAPRSAEWNGYGAEVLAVADATVVAAMDDIPENPDPAVAKSTPVPLEAASGNYVALDLGEGRFAFYEHLRNGTVAVKPGDRVRTGQVIGKLGNSGSSSIGPHLHFHMADTRSPLGAEGLPFVFTAFDELGTFPSIDALVAGDRWQPVAKPVTRTRERPSANRVIQFR